MKKDNGTHRIRKGILAVFMNLILIIFSLSLIATGSLYFSDDLDAVLFVKRKEGI